jgi:hypothetical protein
VENVMIKQRIDNQKLNLNNKQDETFFTLIFSNSFMSLRYEQSGFSGSSFRQNGKLFMATYRTFRQLYPYHQR